MKKQIITLFALAMAPFGFAQEMEVVAAPVQESTVSTSTPSATIYGYVRGEFAFDSRQVIAAREGNYIDLAAPINRETTNGKDLNGLANFNGWGIESRLGVKISGPEFFGMKSSAVLEGHFFGTNEEDINSLSLRHAYVQLSNDNVEWLVGQYWHPMFVTNVSPMTYNFNAGSPFQPFNRSPQIRFSTKGMARVTLAALTERDFTSVVLGEGSAAKSGLPSFHAQVQFGNDDKFVGGLGINYKITRNFYRNSTSTLLERKNANAFNFLAYAKAKLGENLTWQVYGNYGENPTELLQLGGIAITHNRQNNQYKFKNSNVLALWTEFYGNFSPSFEWGLFGGYTKDFGYSNLTNTTTSAVANQAYTQGLSTYPTTANLSTSAGVIPVDSWRISPRFGWKSGNTKLTAEFDYTVTGWGGFELDNNRNATGKLKKLAKDANGDNFRVSLSLIQSF